jgi:nucleoside-diphosphate-sugar epimerase
MGHAITLFHRGRTQANLLDGVQRIQGDRHRLTDFVDAFRSIAPHVVLDMIPAAEQDARMVVNVFRGIAQRVVAISSQDVYRAYGVLLGIEPGAPEPVPLAEDAPLRRKLYPYRGASPRDREDPTRWLDDYDKILVERTIIEDAVLPGTILRLPAVYGPGDPQHRLFAHLKRMDDGRPAILLEKAFAEWRWTRGYVEKVAAAIALAVADDRSAGRIYNVGETEALTEAQWVREIGRAADWHGRIIAVPKERMPTHLNAGINADQHLVADTSRIRRELGYDEKMPRHVALRQTVAWERAYPPDVIEPAQFDYVSEDAVLNVLEETSS